MKRISKKNLILLSILILSSSIILYAKDPGITAFYKGDFEKARDYYEKRLDKNAENEKLLYNAGTASMALQKNSEAAPLLLQSLSSSNSALRASAFYNLGQLSLQNNDFEKALDYYKKSMIEDPDDVNSKIMYEQLRLLMQEKQEQQQKDEQDKSGQTEKQDSRDDSDKNEKQDSQNDENQDENNEQDQNAPEDQEGEDNQQQPTSSLKEDELSAQEQSEEQIRNILNAMREKELDSMKKWILHKNSGKRIKRSKEW